MADHRFPDRSAYMVESDAAGNGNVGSDSDVGEDYSKYVVNVTILLFCCVLYTLSERTATTARSHL